MMNRRKGVDYRILDINPAYEQITGPTREKTIGKKASELMERNSSLFLTFMKE